MVLVSAAAGSGKTSVLVQRIIDLITDADNPTAADKLLVVTFTNAAASEMKARIKKELERMIAADPSDARLRRQSLLLGRAQISTVHAFCASLLRDNFNELGIPADFTMADDVIAYDLRQRALTTTIDKLYSDPNSGMEGLSDLFGRSRSDKDTEKLIDRLYEFETNLAFPDAWEERVVGDIESGAPLAETAVGRYLFDCAEQSLISARDMLSEALELCADDEVLEQKYTDAIQSDFVFVNSALAAVTSRNWDGAIGVLESYKPLSLKQSPGADETLRDAAKELRNQSKSILSELLTNYFICGEQHYLRDTVKFAPHCRALFRAVREYRETLADLKLERRVFEFSDLERYALKLLCAPDGGPAEAARGIAERFDHILVDEYQDTNEIQDLIFKLVSRDEENVFFVGDVKQSIYSFRRADPEIFTKRRESCYDNDTGLFPARIFLPHNFRSSVSVLDAVNSVFAPIMTRATGGTDYADPGEQLVARDGADTGVGTGLDIKLVLKDTDNAEPRFIAKTVAGMIAKGYPVIENGRERPCRESDFCVLLRSAKDRIGDYVSALDDAGVRCWTDGGDDFFGASEVAVMLSLLKIIDNPRRDVDLAAVMLSPLFGFTPDDLARLRLNGGKRTLYSLLAQSEEPAIRQFVTSIGNFRKMRPSMPVGEFIQYLIDSLNAEIALCAGRDFSERRNNLRLLIEYADTFGAGLGASLASFLRVCDGAARNKTGIRRDFSPPADTVCVTTVHKSKGLEWPIVIVANAEKQFNFSDSRDSTMLFDAKYGLGARVRTETADGSALYMHKTVNYAALSLASARKTTSEEMRVLYVALTRARQKVIVTAALSNPANTLKSWRARSIRSVAASAASAKSWIDWIGLAATWGDAAFADTVYGGSHTGGPVSLEIVQLTGEQPGVQPCAVPDIEADPELVAAYCKRLAFKCPRHQLFDVPNKLSVTDITKGSNTSIIYRPRFSRDGLTAAERGSAMHLFMQCADYGSAAKSVTKELERLVSGAYIDAEIAKGIDPKKLERFFESELGQKVVQGKVLREYAFIELIDVCEIRDVPETLAHEKIMLQGIADCVILEGTGAILIDYKTDRVTKPEELIERYRSQLDAYRSVLDKRLPVPVKSCVIYSFELEQAIEIGQLNAVGIS